MRLDRLRLLRAGIVRNNSIYDILKDILRKLDAKRLELLELYESLARDFALLREYGARKASLDKLGLELETALQDINAKRYDEAEVLMGTIGSSLELLRVKWSLLLQRLS